MAHSARAAALFGTGDVVETARLRLCSASPTDVRGMAWLAGAVAPEWEMADIVAHVKAGDAVLISSGEGREIGLSVALFGAPGRGTACLPLIAIEPSERFRGLGGEAALALERRARKAWRVGRVLAPVPEGRGLAVYFWLRLGYRPLTGVEAPWPLVGLNGKTSPGIWMARTEPAH